MPGQFSTFRRSTEYQHQLLTPLADKRRLPAATAALVQQIRQGIFILTRVPRKLDHHSLIFFH